MRNMIVDLMAELIRFVLGLALFLAYLHDVAGIRTWFTNVVSGAAQAAFQ